VKSREEQLTWAKQRALICVGMGRFADAVAGLRADLDKGAMSSEHAMRGYKAAMDAALGRSSQALTSRRLSRPLVGFGRRRGLRVRGWLLGPPAVQASPALRVDHSNSKLVQLVISDLQIVPLLFLQKSDQCIFAGAVIKDGISSRSVIRQNGVC
jgi:hypothetical protein